MSVVRTTSAHRAQRTYNGKDKTNGPHAHRANGQSLIVDWLYDSANFGERRVIIFIRQDLLGIPIAQNANLIIRLIRGLDGKTR